MKLSNVAPFLELHQHVHVTFSVSLSTGERTEKTQPAHAEVS